MSLLSPVSDLPTGHSLSALVGALLSHPRRPDPSELPAPASDAPDPEETAAAAPIAPRGLPGPTGLGTAAARAFLAPVQADVAPQADAAHSAVGEPMPELFCPGPV